MLALALGSGLCLVAAQYYQYAVYMGSVQEHLQQRAERIMVLKLTAGAALQRALYTRPVCFSYEDAPAAASAADVDSAEGGDAERGDAERGDAKGLLDTPVACPTWMQEREGPGINIATAHAPVSALIVPDGDILSIHGDELYGVTQYFTARHVTSGHDALYRRRGAEGGGYQAAEELVTGWSDFRVSGCYRDRDQETQDLQWQCDSAQDSARAFDVLRVCARHDALPGAVRQVLEGTGAESLPARACLVVQTL